MKLYQIIAHVTTVKDGWRCSIGCPTFYLREDMQGITTHERAEEVAIIMLRSLCPDAVDISVLVSVGTIEITGV